MIEYLFLIISILGSSISVIILKRLSKELNFNEGYIVGIKSLINKYSFLAVILVLMSIFFYTLALSRIPLAFAYSFNSITTLLVVIGGYLFYKERINKKQLIGIMFIVLGLFIFSF